MFGKFDTPCLFVKTGTVQSVGFSQTEESLGITRPEQPRCTEDSLAPCAREVKKPQYRGSADRGANAENQANCDMRGSLYA
jgi:hypothetical protein